MSKISWMKISNSYQLGRSDAGIKFCLVRRYVKGLGYSCWYVEKQGVTIGRKEKIKEAKSMAEAA